MEELKITKKEVKDMKLLTDEELQKLSFHELCVYLNMLEIAEKELSEEGDNNG